MAQQAIQGTIPTLEESERLLTDRSIPLLPLLQAAYRVRYHFFANKVRVHILINAQNGYCSEDCNYCAQAAGSEAEITRFRLRSDEEILQGAEEARSKGAYRYCIVLSGRGLGRERAEHMASLVREIKSRWPLEVCVSAGFLDQETAVCLKEAGLDRYNHNLNTAEEYYSSICTTHGYRERLATLETARAQGLEVCSGIIIGMGETPDQVVEVAHTLRRLNARSIPVNFYVHVPGSALGEKNFLTPELGLRALCLFRFCNPDAEIRAAGGREVNLRGLESLALYPASGLFSEGYLNTGGLANDRTLNLIRDAGFEVESIES
ncbi:MAG: biotin synthase BioB [Magnetococcales bacterium]|nr:biotin synthase BioB [Magnetococcales bacterium]NGZ26205.1 biotin synthase BioB [Magnetococcales bacterium]